MNRGTFLQVLAGVFLGLAGYRLVRHPDDWAFAVAQIALAAVALLIGTRLRNNERRKA